MEQIFKTVLILSGFGFVLTAVLLMLKPITAKKFPARWQYIVWIIVMLSMLVPIYKFIPKQEAQKLVSLPGETDLILPEATNDRVYVTIPNVGQPTAGGYTDVTPTAKQAIPIWNLAAHIWGLGLCVYVITVGVSYCVYIAKRCKGSALIENSILLEHVKAELGIKRKIRLKMCSDINSPMLMGVFCPVIYIPEKMFDDESLRMIFLHELAHCKRGDLCIKWLAVFVNAVHWFNPFAYLLCANVGEACEVSCDMEVTKNMSDEEKKIYMRTILDLAN